MERRGLFERREGLRTTREGTGGGEEKGDGGLAGALRKGGKKGM